MKKVLILLWVFTLICLACKTAKKRPTPCQTITLADGITYQLSPCFINDTLTAGATGSKPFSFKIVPSSESASYGFSKHGYGVGFPTYAILGTSSGGASGTTEVSESFNREVLPKGTYVGYLPIHIYLGSETGRDTNFLRLKINLIVK